MAHVNEDYTNAIQRTIAELRLQVVQLTSQLDELRGSNNGRSVPPMGLSSLMMSSSAVSSAVNSQTTTPTRLKQP
jgi:hypothetical protein